MDLDRADQVHASPNSKMLEQETMAKSWARIPDGFKVIVPDSHVSTAESEARARELGETMAAAWRSKLAATDAAAAQKKKHKSRQAAGMIDDEVAGAGTGGAGVM